MAVSSKVASTPPQPLCTRYQTFMDLPGEIRNLIYEFAMGPDPCTKLRHSRPRDVFAHQYPSNIPEFAFAHLSSDIRKEFRPLYFSTKRLTIRWPELPAFVNAFFPTENVDEEVVQRYISEVSFFIDHWTVGYVDILPLLRLRVKAPKVHVRFTAADPKSPLYDNPKDRLYYHPEVQQKLAKDLQMLTSRASERTEDDRAYAYAQPDTSLVDYMARPPTANGPPQPVITRLLVSGDNGPDRKLDKWGDLQPIRLYPRLTVVLTKWAFPRYPGCPATVRQPRFQTPSLDDMPATRGSSEVWNSASLDVGPRPCLPVVAAVARLGRSRPRLALQRTYPEVIV